MRPITFRSTRVRYANPKSTRLITITDLISEIHHGSPFAPLATHEPAHTRTTSTSRWSSDACSSAIRATPSRSRAVDACAELDRRAVRAERYGVSRRDPAPVGVGGRERDLALGPLELELRDPLDLRPGEERPVAQEAERPDEVVSRRHSAPANERRAWREGSGASYGTRGGSGARSPSLVQPPSAVDPAGELLEHDFGVRREADVEACGELREPGELVGDGRDHRTAQALHAALEVHRGSLALERPGRREDQVGPAGGERGEERDDDHMVGPLGERTHARVGRRARRRRRRGARCPLARPRPRPPRRPTPRRRRARWAWRGGGTPRSRASLRSRGRARPLRASRRLHRLGPTRSGRPGPTRVGACRARFSRRSGSAARRPTRPAPRARSRGAPIVTISAPFRRARRSQRSTAGARSTTSSSPITTTSSAAPIVESGARKASSAAEVDSWSTAECAPRPRRMSVASP